MARSPSLPRREKNRWRILKGLDPAEDIVLVMHPHAHPHALIVLAGSQAVHPQSANE